MMALFENITYKFVCFRITLLSRVYSLSCRNFTCIL